MKLITQYEHGTVLSLVITLEALINYNSSM